MKAEELRIGNLVRFRETRREKSKSIVPNDKTEFAIRGILLRERIIGRDNSVWQINHIEPIQLTEEWLVKFGFKHSKEHDKYYTLGNNYAVSTADEKIRFITGNFVCQITLFELTSVHQLQNLYFALTGEELTW